MRKIIPSSVKPPKSRVSRDDLVKYLRPFAQEGKVVNEADVKSFFERMVEEKSASRKNQG